jgi:hypothetical protein
MHIRRLSATAVPISNREVGRGRLGRKGPTAVFAYSCKRGVFTIIQMADVILHGIGPLLELVRRVPSVRVPALGAGLIKLKYFPIRIHEPCCCADEPRFGGRHPNDCFCGAKQILQYCCITGCLEFAPGVWIKSIQYLNNIKSSLEIISSRNSRTSASYRCYATIESALKQSFVQLQY